AVVGVWAADPAVGRLEGDGGAGGQWIRCWEARRLWRGWWAAGEVGGRWRGWWAADLVVREAQGRVSGVLVLADFQAYFIPPPEVTAVAYFLDIAARGSRRCEELPHGLSPSSISWLPQHPDTQAPCR
ncbi:Os11g0307600, partial [Oryza sativa Japonica Group]